MQLYSHPKLQDMCRPVDVAQVLVHGISDQQLNKYPDTMPCQGHAALMKHLEYSAAGRPIVDACRLLNGSQSPLLSPLEHVVCLHLNQSISAK